MAGTEVKVNVELYPLDGAIGIQIEEKTDHWGWIQVLDSASVGSFPDYTTTYSVTLASKYGSFSLRHRWKIGADEYTEWLTPVSAIHAPTEWQQERIKQAIIAKAVRILALSGAPLGTHGEPNEFGGMKVMPDFQIQELLGGLIMRDWDVDLTTLVDVDDITNTEGYDSIPADDTEEVQRAINSAVSWVADYLLGAVPIS